jgi:hypothetical protein
VATVPGDLGFPTGSTDDAELLLQWLGYVRRAVLRNVRGITDAAARWTPPGKLTPLIGIVHHLTLLEWRWIDGGFRGADVSYQPETEFRADLAIPIAQVIDAYRKRATDTDALVRATPLTTIGSGWARGHDLRFVLLHVIEETARHAGHADATREMLDGTTGL